MWEKTVETDKWRMWVCVHSPPRSKASSMGARGQLDGRLRAMVGCALLVPTPCLTALLIAGARGRYIAPCQPQAHFLLETGQRGWHGKVHGPSGSPPQLCPCC